MNERAEWVDSAWASLAKGLRVSSFLQQVVMVVAVFVVLGVVGLLVGAVVADESSDRIGYLLSAIFGFFFWSLVLGALYALATLVEVQSHTLATSLPDDETLSA